MITLLNLSNWLVVVTEVNLAIYEVRTEIKLRSVPKGLIDCNQWRTEGVLGGLNPPPKFRSFDKAEPK
jgi:hypothetical protein